MNKYKIVFIVLLIISELGMKLVHIGLGCGTGCETHVYER